MGARLHIVELDGFTVVIPALLVILMKLQVYALVAIINFCAFDLVLV